LAAVEDHEKSPPHVEATTNTLEKPPPDIPVSSAVLMKPIEVPRSFVSEALLAQVALSANTEKRRCLLPHGC